jgi:phage recombination protein Bet
MEKHDMTTEMTVREDGSVPLVSWTHEQVELIKRTIAVNATPDELQLFLYQAKRTGLDPLSRQIHFVKRKDKGTIQTAIDGYRLIADRTGKYAGSDDYLFDEGIPQYLHMIGKDGKAPVTATVTVYKMCDGSKVAFTATAGWSEYFPGELQGFMWKKMPYLMIGKCAEALALRKAFPAELSGIYTNEEMQQADAGPAMSHASMPVSNEWHVPNYGPDAGQPFSTVKTEHLKDYLTGAERSIKDPKKANFLQKNEAMRDALQEEIAKRESPPPQASEVPTHEAPGADPSQDLADKIGLSQSVAECAAVGNEIEAAIMVSDEDKRALRVMVSQRITELTMQKRQKG